MNPALLLHHLRHELGQMNRPNIDNEGLDRVLQLRQNRYVGISREGIAVLSWPTTPSKTDPEITNWPKHFHTIYRVLAEFVHGGSPPSSVSTFYFISLIIEFRDTSLKSVNSLTAS